VQLCVCCVAASDGSLERNIPELFRTYGAIDDDGLLSLPSSSGAAACIDAMRGDVLETIFQLLMLIFSSAELYKIGINVR